MTRIDINRLILSESLRLVGLLFSTIQYNHHSYNSCNHKNANSKENPKEPLGIVTEIAAIIFLYRSRTFFRSSANMELTSWICICAVILWRSLANSSCVFCLSASLTFTETFNWVGAFFKNLSICWLMVCNVSIYYKNIDYCCCEKQIVNKKIAISSKVSVRLHK